MINLENINKYRVKNGLWVSKDTDDFGLFFIKYKSSQIPLKVLSSGWKGDEWYHVSVSLPNRCPTWEEMCFIKELFFGDNVAIQFHPKKKDYVNNHPYCLHLWCNMKEEIKTPNSNLVGIL